MEYIHTDDAPRAVGPYSQAVAWAGYLFCAGQIALDPESGELVGDDAAAQARQALENLGAVLAAGGSAPEHVLKTTVYVKDMADYAAVNEVYAEFFGTHRPARAAVAVSALPKNALVEIDAVARRSA